METQVILKLQKLVYDEDIISYKELLNLYWKNIDPFDSAGQFCDKGLSYRSVMRFIKRRMKKNEIKNSI